MNLCLFPLFKIIKLKHSPRQQTAQDTLLIKPCSLPKHCVCWRSLSGTAKTSPSPLSGKLIKESSTRIQDFAFCEVFCQLIAGSPTSPAIESIQATSPQDSALAVCHEYVPQVPNLRPQELGMQEGSTDHLAPYPICPFNWPTQEERH